MPLMNWSNDFSVTVPEMDEQHKRLFAMINELHDARSKGQGQTVIKPLLQGLVQYTRTHFSAEEQLLQRAKYAEFAQHKALHEKLIKQVLDLKARSDAGQAGVTVELMNFLKTWLVSHIQGVDKKYGAVVMASAAQRP
jgi:hemerythrin